MRKWMAILLSLALLLGAACAEGDDRGSLKNAVRRKNMQSEAVVDEAKIAQLRALLDIALSGDKDALLAASAEGVADDELLQGMMELIAGSGEVISVELIDAGAEPDGGIAGIFGVQHESGRIRYTVEMDESGRLRAINMRTDTKSMEDAPASELQADVDYKTIVDETIRMLADGSYEEFLANCVPELFEGQTPETIAGYVEMFGAPRMYSLYSVAEQSGYIQYVAEVMHDQPVLWQIVLSGDGRVAGLFLQQKQVQRTEPGTAEYRQRQEKARGYFDLLLAQDFESFRSALAEQYRNTMDVQSIHALFAELGAFEAISMHDMYESDGIAAVEFITSFEKHDMLTRIYMNADGELWGFNTREIIYLPE